MTGLVTGSRIPTWSDVALRRLRNTAACPVCNAAEVLGQRCRRCGADFTDGIGAELWEASQTAVTALEARQAVLDRVPVRSVARTVAPVATAPARLSPPPAAGTSATVQSVLAVAGAGLVAIAAIVFTFFNPDLTDSGIRNAVTAGVTLLFLAGARLLVARKLRFSAEAVGGLGVVFVALDVSAVAGLGTASPWTDAAVATLLAASALLTLGLLWRLRTWILGALVAAAFVPVMLAAGATWSTAPLLGWFGTAVAASVLLEACRVFGRRIGSPLLVDRVALTVVQIVANTLAAVTAIGLFGVAWSTWLLCGLLAATAVLSAFSARHLAAWFWSFGAGGSGVLAFIVLPYAAFPALDAGAWYLALLPSSTALGLVVVAAVAPLPTWVRRAALTAGALTGVALGAVIPTVSGALAVGLTVFGDVQVWEGPGAYDGVVPIAVGLGALAAGLMLFSSLRRETPASAADMRWAGDLGLWYAALSVLVLASAPSLPLLARIAIGIGAAAAVALTVISVRSVRTARTSVRAPLLAGAHAAVVLGALLSWHAPDLTVGAGVAVVAAIALVGRAMPQPLRFVYVGVAYAYALVVVATGLDRLGVEPLPLVCLVTCAGALVAVIATFLSRVGPRAWQAILVVTSVPFALGVLQVAGERSGWTALSTSLMFLLALTLVVTRRPGLGRVVRALAAASLVPSLAVVVVCLGAQLLAGSGSPVVLPVIAALVAIVLPSMELARSALAPRIGGSDAVLSRLAIESSALVTAAIAVALALVRDAAGLGTTLLVLVILGVGAVATGAATGRRYAWWVAAASFTGALWCVWGLQGITAVEPYLLPPALGAALVGAVLTARGRRGVALYAAGLAVAIVPIVVLLAVEGGMVRGTVLLAASWALLALAWGLGAAATRFRRTGVPWRGAWRLRALRTTTYAAAIGAGAAGAVFGARFGIGADAAPEPVVLVGLGVGLVGAAAAGLGAVGVRRTMPVMSRIGRSRWLLAPSLVSVGVAAWPAIHRDWFTIWTMWALMLAYLVVVVVTSVRLRAAGAENGAERPTILPPVWFTFTLAFATAVVAWSPRDLRVEWFSLPLGLMLIAAGALHLRRVSSASGIEQGRADASATGIRRSLASWPAGWSGSWALLTPGLVVTFSASISATFTDPQTWRAILVIALALLAILVGARGRLAAPFVTGIIVLPVENVLAFVVQIGRGIASMPWWITLAVVGAVLLIIAVSYERREGEEMGVVARLRDLD